MAQLVVALDVPGPDEAEQLIDRLYELDIIAKIGLEALCGYPERILSYCESRDVRTFIDAKLHDIPRTVGAAIRATGPPERAHHQRARAGRRRDDARRRRRGGRIALTSWASRRRISSR